MILTHNGVEVLEKTLSPVEQLEQFQEQQYYNSIIADWKRQQRAKKRKCNKYKLIYKLACACAI